MPRAASDCTTELGLGWKAAPPSGTASNSENAGLNISRAMSYSGERGVVFGGVEREEGGRVRKSRAG